ncbi:MAG: molybdopterin converting factor subunit 1 [Rhodospirillaceae bacterium]|nr:molybdopterin converting factor subunit 1 [Rhodospirillaceae bacterium]MCA8932164.1 molybdopterin converting factor subunit 1 [Rhodospirillaceae bacterium]
MHIRYFAWLRQRIGVAEETVSPPGEVADVAGLMAWLKARGAPYDTAFEPDEVIRVAINQVYARRDAPVGPGDEVAFFPPVTGG